MDNLLSEFITKSCADPGLARDLLEGHGWDLKSALNAYYIMKGMPVQKDASPRGLFSDQLLRTSKERDIAEEDEGEEEAQERETRGQGISSTSGHFNPTLTNGIPSNCAPVKFSSEPSLSPSSLPPSKESSADSSPSKLAISKLDVNEADLIDEAYPKKLARGISRATDNVNLVSKARTQFAQDFRMSSRGSRLINENCIMETPDFTFTLPDLSIHPNDFREFLEKDLIEKSTLVSLENAGRLNWWSDQRLCQRLWPLATSGDGNCLLHAASLGMWGFHDRLLTLRKALYALLVNSGYTSAFYRRWRWQATLQNKEAGLILCEEEWQREWQTLLKMASTEPRVRANVESNKKSTELNGGKKIEVLPEDEMQPHVYESLEEIHILALAHVLKRPIIVIADTMLKDVTGEPFAPIPFGGIYLPLECSIKECHVSPLCLTYDAAHFSALVAMDKETYADRTPHPAAAIPLTDPERALLPLQFAVDPGPDVSWGQDENNEQVIKKMSLTDKAKIDMLKSFLDVTFVTVPSNESTTPVAAEESTSRRRGARNGILEKSMTLPSNFEFDDSASSDAGTTVSAASSSGLNGHSGRGFVAQSRSKAAKQLQMITKHFGSLGRSMSKKLKRNLGSLARRGSSFRSKSSNSSPTKKVVPPIDSRDSESLFMGNSDVNRQKRDELTGVLSEKTTNSIIAAHLHTERRHDYHEEMIRNYLNTARLRFLRFQKDKERKDQGQKQQEKDQKGSPSGGSYCSSSPSQGSSGPQGPEDNFAAQCVQTGCSNFGTAATNYLCASCLADQKEELNKGLSETHNKDSKCISRDSNHVYHSNHNSKVALDLPGKSFDSSEVTLEKAVSCPNSAFYVSSSS